MGKVKTNLFLFGLLACLWGGSFVGIKAVVEVWPPLFSAAMRVAIAFISLFILIIMIRRDVSVSLKVRLRLWLVGLFAQALPFTFLFWGEQYVSPGLAGVLNGSAPIWAFTLSMIFFPRMNSFSFLKLCGLFVGICGVLLVFWPVLGLGTGSNVFFGTVSITLMAISYGIGALLNQHLLSGHKRTPFFTNIYHQHCASLIFLLAISFIFEKWSTIPLFISYTPWIACLYLGVFSTALAWLIYYYLIREWDAIRASTVMYVVPAMAIFWDFVFFKNFPTIWELYGVVAILLGVIMIQWTKRTTVLCYK